MRKLVMTSIVSAMLGAGLMLLATGASKPAGIEGWVPVNVEVAAALNEAAEGERATSSGEVQVNVNAMSAAKAETEEGQPSTSSAAVAQSAGKSEAAASDIQENIVGVASGSTVPGDTAETHKQVVDSSLISINQAGLLELQDIPGVGEKKAQAIMDYRDAHGGFTSIEELTEVKGIGDKMLAKMKPYIRL
ncbi:ComEA family DNA-binding protein [Paenibacillus sanguinis]|uniref:ComEA family DNA-binding protein n=1 Tax=Paenibacillus sanguinis TaxID=225906 RepID=UPI000372F808|nr:helix-hairpin-helix domain-containing protein [Paenibacillus sanguinis]